MARLTPRTLALLMAGLTASTPAMAMPQLVGLALLALGSYMYYVWVVATIVYGESRARRKEREARERFNNGLVDRNVVVISAEEPWHIVAGRCVKGYGTVAVITTGARDEFKHVVGVWADHRCDAIEDILLNGTSVGALDVNGDASADRWRPVEQDVIREAVTITPEGVGIVSMPIVQFIVGTTEQPVVGEVRWRGGDVNSQPLPPQDVASVGDYAFQIATAQISKHAGNTYWVQYVTGVGLNTLRVRHFLGTDDQAADAELIAEAGGAWTSDDRLRGLCYSKMRFDLNEQEFQPGPPPVGAQIRGLLCYDPRLDSTRPGGSGAHRVDQPATWSWTRSPPLIIGRFLMAEWGKRASPTQIDWASVAVAANACAEPLASQGGAPRYTCDGSWTTDRDPDEVLEELCLSMAGYVTFDGIWTVIAGVYTAPVMDLTDADTAGAIEIAAAPTGDLLFNGVRGRFFDPARQSQITDYPPYRNAALVTEDKRPMWRNQDFNFTNAAWRCHNIARILVERERGQRIVLPAKLRTLALKPGQRVRLSLRFPTYSLAIFRVVKRQFELEKGRVLLTLAQDDPSYWDEADAPASLTSPVQPRDDPFVVDPPASLAATSSAAVSQRDPVGNIISNVRLTYAAAAQEFVRTGGALQVEYRHATEETWIRAPEAPGISTACDLPLLRPRGAYTVRARWRNSLGVVSDWRAVGVVVADMQTATRGSLVSSASWRAGTSGSQGPFLSGGPDSHNAIELALAPDGIERPVWRCTETDTDFNSIGGGWEVLRYAIDRTAMYRLSVWVQVVTAGPAGPSDLGNVYLGSSTFGGDDIADIGGGVNANPYHLAPQRSLLVPGRWYLMTGFVFPEGYAGAQLNRSGLYEGLTGQRVGAGTDFRWSSTAVGGNMRCFQYYTGNGAVSRFWGPRVDLCDGLEPSLDELLAVARIKALYLTASSMVVRVPKAAGALSPSSIAFTAQGYNLAGAPAFDLTAGTLGGSGLTGSGSVRSIATADMSSDLITVRVQQDGLADTVTVVKVREGEDGTDGADGAPGAPAIVAKVDRNVVVFAADSTGLVDAGQSYAVTLKVERGTTDETGSWTISRTASDASITTSLAGAVVTISGMGTALEQGHVDITATRAGSPTQVVRVSVNKVKRASPASSAVPFSLTVVATRTGGATADSALRLNADGTIDRRVNNGSWTSAGNWYTPTTAGIGSSFQARVANTGDALAFGTTGETAEALSGAPIWRIDQVDPGFPTYIEKTAALTFTITPTAGGAPVLSTAWLKVVQDTT